MITVPSVALSLR